MKYITAVIENVVNEEDRMGFSVEIKIDRENMPRRLGRLYDRMRSMRKITRLFLTVLDGAVNDIAKYCLVLCAQLEQREDCLTNDLFLISEQVKKYPENEDALISMVEKQYTEILDVYEKSSKNQMSRMSDEYPDFISKMVGLALNSVISEVAQKHEKEEEAVH